MTRKEEGNFDEKGGGDGGRDREGVRVEEEEEEGEGELRHGFYSGRVE